MNRITKALILGTLSFTSAWLGAGCSTAKVRVMPGENEHRVVARDMERDGASVAATDAAREYCEDKGKEAIFLSDNTKYDGRMEEDTRNTIRQGSKVAMMMGGTRGAGSGSLFSAMGRGGYQYTNERDYQAEVRFKCR